MAFRKKRKLFLASIAILLVLLIIDIWVNKGAVFERLGDQFANDQKTEAYIDDHQAVEKTARRQLEMEGQQIKEIVLSNSSGDIYVDRAPGDTILLQYEVTVSAKDEEQADQTLSKVLIDQEAVNGVLSYTPDMKSLPLNSLVAMDYRLSVPDGLQLRIESERGAVYINGIKGNVIAEAERGLMEMIHVEGDVTVNAVYQQLYISHINGSVTLENQHGHANIDQINGTFMLESQYGNNFITQVTGKITTETNFGTLHLREISEPVVVKSRYTEVQLANIRNDLKVEAQLGELIIDLSEAQGYTMDATVTNGSVQTRLPFDIEKSGQDTQLTGAVGKGTFHVDLDVESAPLILHSNLPD